MTDVVADLRHSLAVAHRDWCEALAERDVARAEAHLAEQMSRDVERDHLSMAEDLHRAKSDARWLAELVLEYLDAPTPSGAEELRRVARRMKGKT